MQDQKYLPVNWTDGMKINKTHFISQDNAVTYQLAQNISSLLHEYNYGLLPAPAKNMPGVKLYLSMDNQQQVHLLIIQCQAITRGGHLIQFEEDNSLHADYSTDGILPLSVPFQDLKRKDSTYLIVITINPYMRVPFGFADLEESPPRLPYSSPLFELSLVPAQDTNKNLLGLYQLPVGKLKIEEHSVSLDEEYLPPCSSISSHYDLMEIHAALEQFYGKLELYCLQIIQKILQKKQFNEMAAIVQKLCENVSIFTSSQLAEIKTLSIHQPPVYLINKVSSMARLFKNTLDYYIGSGKEEFINYCIEWCNISQGELENSITTFANHEYDHLNLNVSIEKMRVFTKVISNLFSNLARLEYIGKRRDAGIFVKEKLVTNEPEEPRKRKSFLVD